MTSAAITLGCIVILPIALIIALRVNAALVFLSVCLGDVMTQFVATNTNPLANLLSSNHVTSTLHTTNTTWKLVLFLLPIVITTAIMVHTVKGNSKMVLNLLPAAGVGLVGALLVVPLLPLTAAQDLINNSLWNQLTNYQGIIVAVSALACLPVLWLQRPKGGSGKHGKHGS